MRVVRMIDECGTVLNEWTSQKACAIDMRITRGGLNARIKRGTVIAGVKFVQIEILNGVETIRIPKRGPKKEKEPKEPRKPVFRPNQKRGHILHEVPYETKNGAICLTDCPFKAEEPRIKVGSPRCSQCHSFKKKDKEKKVVYCTFLMYGYRNSKEI